MSCTYVMQKQFHINPYPGKGGGMTSKTTGNTTDSVEIPTASPGFSTMASQNKVSPLAKWLRQWPTTKNGNIDVLGANLAIFIYHDRNQLANPLSNSSSSKIQNLATEFRRYLSEFQRYNYFRFWRLYRYFRLSVAVVLTCQHYFPPIYGLKLQIRRWNFNCTSHSFRDIIISGFGRHFRLSVIIGIA